MKQRRKLSKGVYLAFGKFHIWQRTESDDCFFCDVNAERSTETFCSDDVQHEEVRWMCFRNSYRDSMIFSFGLFVLFRVRGFCFHIVSFA